MKPTAIPLKPASSTTSTTVHSVALATFKFMRHAGAQAAKLPAVLTEAAKDVSNAWADSRPKS